MRRLLAIVVFGFLLAGASGNSVDPRALGSLARFETAWKNVKTLEYTMNKLERMRDGEMRREIMFVKFARPGKFYLGNLEPDLGQEVLYDVTKRPNELLIHLARLPGVSGWLDIHGSWAIEGQHHAISHCGFGYLQHELRRMVDNVAQGKVKGAVTYLETLTDSKSRVDEVTVVLEGNPGRTVVAQKGERLVEFGQRVGMDAYRILMENKDIENLWDELEGGHSYWVPTNYAARIWLQFDLKTGLVQKFTAWDAKGNIYEQYQFTDTSVNPKFSANEFDSENPQYRF